MRYELATDNQLQTIIKYDKDCSPCLLGGAVHETMNRGLFDRILASCIHKLIRNMKRFEQVYKVSLEDLMQMARVEVLKTVEKFKPNAGMSFLSFAYLKVQSLIIHEIQALNAQKRDVNKTTSYNVPTESGDEIVELFSDQKTNVEKYVIDKLTIEQLLQRVNEHQKTVLLYRLQGYGFREISELMGRGSEKTISQAYRLAIKKMRKGAYYADKISA